RAEVHQAESMNRLVLKTGREKSLKRHHPWVFSGAIEKVEGKPESGETVEVRSGDGELLAIAAYSAHSQIRARVWAWNECDIDASFFLKRVTDAAVARAAVGTDKASDAWRLVHAESD